MAGSNRSAVIVVAVIVLLVFLSVSSSSTDGGWATVFYSGSSAVSSSPSVTQQSAPAATPEIQSASSAAAAAGDSARAKTQQQQDVSFSSNIKGTSSNFNVLQSAASTASIFPSTFLNSEDAAGQVWEFSAPSLNNLLLSKKMRADELTPRGALKSTEEIAAEYESCKDTGSVLGDPNATEVLLASLTTPMWTATDSDIDAICQKRGTSRIQDDAAKPLLIYGALFGFEVDVVEMVMHEALPVVDAMVLVESSTTHSLKQKPLVFKKLLNSRLRRYAGAVATASAAAATRNKNSTTARGDESAPFPSSDADLQSASWFGNDDSIKIFHRVFSPRGKERSGWTIERKQRREFQRSLPLVLKHIGGVDRTKRRASASSSSLAFSPRPVIVVSQLDLDEIPTRETLLYWKHCQNRQLPLRVIWYRYQLECQQEQKHSRFSGTVWKMPSVEAKIEPSLDLYARRRWVSRINPPSSSPPPSSGSTSSKDLALGQYACQMLLGGGDSTAWHLSAFGGVKSVFRKNKHSPHTHVRRDSMEKVADQIRNCIYNGEARWKLPPRWWQCAGSAIERKTSVMPVALPHFIAENICMFTRMGWMS